MTDERRCCDCVHCKRSFMHDEGEECFHDKFMLRNPVNERIVRPKCYKLRGQDEGYKGPVCNGEYFEPRKNERS